MNRNILMWVRPNTYVGDDVPVGPTPEEAGLRTDRIYLVLDLIADTDPDSEALVCIVNEEGEIWFISNRHVRVDSMMDKSSNRPILPVTYTTD